MAISEIQDSPFLYLRTLPKESELLERYNWLCGAQAGRNQVILKMRDYYDGIGLVSELEAEGIRLVVNDVRRIIDTYVDFMAPAFDIQVPPPFNSEQGKGQADKIERLLYSQWQRNYQKTKLQEICHNLVLGGGCPIYIHPVSARQTRRGVYVSIITALPDCFYGVPISNDRYSYSEVFAVEKRTNAEIENIYGVKPSGTSYDTTDVVFYWNPYWFCLMINGAVVNNSKVKPIRHDWGFVPWTYIPNRAYPGMTNSSGEANGMVAFNKYINELLSDAADMISEYAHPTLVGINTGRSRQDWVRGGFNEIKAGGQVKYLEWSGSAIRETTDMVTEVRMFADDSVANPKMSNAEGARGAKQLMMGMMPFDVRMNQKKALLSDGLQVTNEQILMAIENLYAGQELSIRGTKRGESYNMKFTVNSIAGFYDNVVIWKPGPIDYQARVISTLQLLGAKLVSRYTSREELGIQSPVEEEARIQEEMLADLEFQTKLRDAQLKLNPPPVVSTADQLNAPEKGATGEPPTPTRVGPGRPPVDQATGLEKPEGAAPAGSGPAAGPGKMTPKEARAYLQEMMAKRKAVPAGRKFTLNEPGEETSPETPPEGAPAAGGPAGASPTEVTPPETTTAGTINLDEVMTTLRTIKKLKGRVFITGELSDKQSTSGPIELSLTNALDKATIVNGMSKYRGKINFTVLKNQGEPNGNYVEVIPADQGTGPEGVVAPTL